MKAPPPPKKVQQEEADPFGLDSFMTETANKGRKAMESIGKGGGMAARGGTKNREDYEGGASRDKLRFAKGKSLQQTKNEDEERRRRRTRSRSRSRSRDRGR